MSSFNFQTGAVETEHYHDGDLTIGAVLNIWGRKLLLCDCDEFTKEYYRTKYGIGEAATHIKSLKQYWYYTIPEAMHASLTLPPMAL